jgi:hypothetical protein
MSAQKDFRLGNSPSRLDTNHSQFKFEFPAACWSETEIPSSGLQGEEF